ncbi:MAG: 5-oxoprolinase subunit PxpB [Fulvivirga sp.]
MIDIIRYGESALLVNFKQSIDISINQKVIQLNNRLKNLDGIEFLIPAYNSLTVGYNPQVIIEKALTQFIKANINAGTAANTNRLLKIPVCYDEQFGLDIAELCSDKNITKEELIEVHTSTTYHVYMLGFIPGFAYMGKTDEILHCSRKKEPRQKIEGRSVAIAGAQTGIYPTDAPGGWQIIGKTPIDVIQKSAEKPFLFQPSDQVQCYPIGIDKFRKLEEAYKQGSYEVEITNE